MLRGVAITIGLVLLSAAPSWAVTTLIGGDHIPGGAGLFTFPIVTTSDSDERLSAIDLFLEIEPDGPLITKVDLINGTVFESNNVGQWSWGPEYETPSHTPAYSTVTLAGTVPTGIVAWVTIDWTNVAYRQYTLSLYSDALGASTVYSALGERGDYQNGIICGICPEPGGLLMALCGAVGVATIAMGNRRRRSG